MSLSVSFLFRISFAPRDRLLCGSRGFFTLSHSVHSPGARGDCGDGLRSLAALPGRRTQI